MNPVSVGDTLYRQGDVPLVVAQLPPTAKRVDAGRVILAYGEQTGHHHRFESSAVLYADGDDRFVEVGDVATAIAPTSVEPYDDSMIRVFDHTLGLADGLAVRMPASELAKIEAAIKASAVLTYPGELLRHEEHDAIVVAPGVYQAPGQREYTSKDMPAIRVTD